MNSRVRWLIPAISIVGITLLLYVALAVLYPLAAGLLKPRHTWAMQVDVNPWIAVAHMSIYLALLLAYLAACAVVRVPKIWIWLAWLAFAAVLLFTFPGESADIFDYLFRGRMMADFGLSPLTITPYDVRQYAFHRYVSWSQWVDAYGPLWEYASAGVSLLVRLQASPAELAVVAAGNGVCIEQPVLCVSLAHYVTAYRLLALVLSALCGLLIHHIVKRERGEAAAHVALLGWLWNPLVLISTAVGAHNDVLMLVFVLLAVGCFQRQRFLLGLMALLLAAHVKITALVLLPVLAVWLIRRAGWLKASLLTGGALLIMLPVSWLLYAPLGGWSSLPKNLYERTLLSTNSLGELVVLFLRNGLGWGKLESQQPVARIFPLAFVIVAGIVLVHWLLQQYRHKKVAETSQLYSLSLLTTLLFLLIGSYWFQAWYLAWPMALAWLRPESRLATRTLPIFATGAMIASILSDYLRHAATPLLTSWQISALVVGVMALALGVGCTFLREAKGLRGD